MDGGETGPSRAADMFGQSPDPLYPHPTADFSAIADHIAIYAGPTDACSAGEESVKP